MLPKTETITIAGMTIEVIRKKIKSLRLGVFPPEGKVKISVPHFFNQQMLLTLITNKFEWITETRKKILSHPIVPQLNFVTGESHRLFGQTYTLKVTEHQGKRAQISIHDQSIEMKIPHGYTKADRQDCLNRWYRDQLKSILPPMFEKWSKVLGVEANQWLIKKMKTRWGTCNPRAKRITISLELAKHSHECIEYVVCHELAHLLEASHNQRFKSIMTAAIPNWKLLQRKLNPRSKAK
jgi:predicted metal-dependent hydrolase